MNDNVPEKLLKPYNPKETEGRVYEKWEKSGFFNPDICVENGVTSPDAEVFGMVLPPPNVTGTLHMGHAAMLAIEDTLARFHRMKGKRTLWLPGTDHAAIATQSKVESIIYKAEDKTRHDFSREEFLKRVEQFASESHDTIVGQIKRMGASVDWSREAYTLDEKRNLAVKTAFKRMYDAGLIYRGDRVVNWDPKGQTTVSDEEVVYREEKGNLYTFKYSPDFPITIATTRPETKVGDTAVAVHPDDARYKDFVGKTFNIDFVGVPLSIKVVADNAIDQSFGTGAVGITPAHSMTDFEIASRHGLPLVSVINEYGKMNIADPELNGKKTKEARAIIVERLRTKGLLEKEESIAQNIPRADRTNGVIEQLPKLQWFVAVNKPFKMGPSKIPGIKEGEKTTLKEILQVAVAGGAIKIFPDRFEKVYSHWILNLRDWCISRQILFGHRVPVWYKDKEIYCGIEAPSGNGWEQDPDTLDTWFSSGLWTFSTLGWPDTDAPDFKTYHPTSVLETGYDILFFWVVRMILMSGFLLGDVPFRNVYLHGLVRDGKGQKMSKSLGNSIDPVDMTEKYGADAARLSLLVGNAPGNDLKLSEDKIRGYKHFANKLWNITRFVLSAGGNGERPDKLSEADNQIISEFKEIISDVTKDIEEFRLHLASEKLYHYAWHRFADVIIEESKPILSGSDTALRPSRVFVLETVLADMLRLLHPFIPFVTEEIWSVMPARVKHRDMLMVENWPMK